MTSKLVHLLLRLLSILFAPFRFFLSQNTRRRVPIMTFTLLTASGVACAVGAMRLSNPIRPVAALSASNGSTGHVESAAKSNNSSAESRHADARISADNSASVSSGSSAQFSVNSTVSSAGQSGATRVTVNGQTIPLSADGTVHKVITDNSGTTTVQITSTSDITSNSSVHMELNNTSTGGLE